MLKKWHKYWGTEKLLRRVNKGIPDSVRGEVWKHVLDIEGVKEPDIYEVKSVNCLCVHKLMALPAAWVFCACFM